MSTKELSSETTGMTKVKGMISPEWDEEFWGGYYG